MPSYLKPHKTEVPVPRSSNAQQSNNSASHLPHSQINPRRDAFDPPDWQVDRERNQSEHFRAFQSTGEAQDWRIKIATALGNEIPDCHYDKYGIQVSEHLDFGYVPVSHKKWHSKCVAAQDVNKFTRVMYIVLDRNSPRSVSPRGAHCARTAGVSDIDGSGSV
eukprot:251305_1